MLAILYLIIATAIGDLLGRRFLRFVSLPHRLASAFLIGIILSTWFTYLSAYAFLSLSNPMLWANVLFFVVAVGFLIHQKNEVLSGIDLEGWKAEIVENKWEWLIILIFGAAVIWLMFSTFSMSSGAIQIANHQWSDFGSTVSIMQSFADGRNFPTEYPHFSGERIRYHFLFYFQAGNLEYLGLSPAVSNNLLSIFSLGSLLILVMTFARVLFRSHVVGWIAAALFFFHGSLAFIPFLNGTGSISAALEKIWTMKDFLPSGFPYRGEDWGVWSQVVYLNQRHFASSIGIFFIVLIFLALRYREKVEPTNGLDAEETSRETVEDDSAWRHNSEELDWKRWFEHLSPFIFSGFLLGLLPFWNGVVFAGSAAVLALLFVLFPFKKEMAALAIAAGITALPQIMYLKGGMTRPPGYSLFYFGYTLSEPSLLNVFNYLFVTFGFKLVLIAIALYFASGWQRRVMAAISVLIAIAFCFQFSEEVLANHKFLNMWIVAANVFVAFALVKLWNVKWHGNPLPARITAVVLAVLITIGGVIDFFPIKNSYWVTIPYQGDPLVEWLKTSTDPKAIFLTDRFVNHRILMAGRRVFYGHPYYAWGAGYDTGTRDRIYKKMFEEKNAGEVLRLLLENNIAYVAIDDGVRNGGFIKNINESVYENNFEKVFTDPDGRYGKLYIYKVSKNLEPQQATSTTTDHTEDENEEKGSVAKTSAFEGGIGTDLGQFDKPRGIAVDKDGNFYVADLGNARVQKFSSDGKFISAIGRRGTGEGELNEPNGVAVDASGNIYVADALNQKLLKFKSDGTFIKQWKGTEETDFYGPRDLAIGPNKQLYILDQGRARVVRFDPQTEAFSEWGTGGSDAGQFKEPTGIAVGGGLIFVTDAGNNRIQVFDLDGKFLRQWEVPVWDRYLWHYPDAVFDEQSKRLYVTSGWTKEVISFDVDGNALDGFKLEDGRELDNPSALAILEIKKQRRLLVLETGSARVSAFELEPKKTK